MSPHPHSCRSGIARTAFAVAMGVVLAIGLTAPSFARPHLGGGGGGNVGGHFSGTVHFGGGGFHPSGGGAHRPIPPHPRPVPHPVHPLPHPPHPPHPPGPPHPPYPPGPHPHPHPAWWIPGVAAWDAAWDAAALIYVLPTSCRSVIVDSVKYAECGSAWYEMVYHGTQLAYLPVPDPR